MDKKLEKLDKIYNKDIEKLKKGEDPENSGFKKWVEISNYTSLVVFVIGVACFVFYVVKIQMNNYNADTIVVKGRDCYMDNKENKTVNYEIKTYGQTESPKAVAKPVIDIKGQTEEARAIPKPIPIKKESK